MHREARPHQLMGVTVGVGRLIRAPPASSFLIALEPVLALPAPGGHVYAQCTDARTGSGKEWLCPEGAMNGDGPRPGAAPSQPNS